MLLLHLHRFFDARANKIQLRRYLNDFHMQSILTLEIEIQWIFNKKIIIISYRSKLEHDVNGKIIIVFRFSFLFFFSPSLNSFKWKISEMKMMRARIFINWRRKRIAGCRCSGSHVA